MAQLPVWFTPLLLVGIVVFAAARPQDDEGYDSPAAQDFVAQDFDAKADEGQQDENEPAEYNDNEVVAAQGYWPKNFAARDFDTKADEGQQDENGPADFNGNEEVAAKGYLPETLPHDDLQDYNHLMHDAYENTRQDFVTNAAGAWEETYDTQDFNGVEGETAPAVPGSSQSGQSTDQLQNVTDFIIQGRLTKIVNCPWQVHLQIFKPTAEHPKGSHFFCGGSIVNSFWIITAAHCVENAIEVKVILGSTDQNARSSPYARIVLADQHVSHPKYGREMGLVKGKRIHLGNRFDVALVSVAKGIEFNSVIKPIAIEKPGWTGQPDEMFTAYGWGQTSGIDEKSGSDTLRSVRIPMVSTEYCYQQYNIEIGAEMICVGSRDRGVCKGDSGGPLVNENQNLIGIVSYGTPLCNSYSLFTKVSHPDVYLWINKTVYSYPDAAQEEVQSPLPAIRLEEEPDSILQDQVYSYPDAAQEGEQSPLPAIRFEEEPDSIPQDQVAPVCLRHDAACEGTHMTQGPCCSGLVCYKGNPNWKEGRCYYGDRNSRKRH